MEEEGSLSCPQNQQSCLSFAVLSASLFKKLYKPARDMEIMKKVCKILWEDLQEQNGGD
ncbi:unnamed protein product [Bubo scandiacus]